MRTLIAAVGYRNLSDLSIGPNLFDILQETSRGPEVDVEDLSYGPIAVVQNLQDQRPYDRMVFIGAGLRGRTAGRFYRYNWDHTLPSSDEIQARICEAVTGVINLENLLIIGQYFRVLAPEVIVYEVEPFTCDWGEEMSDAVREIVPELLSKVRAEAYA